MDRKSAVTAAVMLLAVVFVVPIVTMRLFKDGLYYPHLVINASRSVDTDFLFPGRKGQADCEKVLGNMVQAITSVCSTCEVKERNCYGSLDPSQRRILSPEPLDIPSSRASDGVVTYRSTDAQLALLTCRESEKQSKKFPAAARLKCYEPFAIRPFVMATEIDRTGYTTALLFLIVSAVAGWIVSYLLIHFQDVHAHVSHDHTSGAPQKFHAVATPRIGGLAVLAGILTTGIGLLPIAHRFSVEEYGYFVLAGLPAFAAGFAEDITKKVGVLPRLLATMLAAALCAWLLAAILRRVDMPLLDSLLLVTPFAAAFTIFAVGGVANAINIIDGYHGLVGGYGIIVLAAIGWVSVQVGDMFILTASLSMAGALLGFLMWNYPKGKIFLGDGGAYFVGFWLAELSVLLVTRHDSVSPWFPFVLLLYPVFETVFSIYRRIACKGNNPGNADALHFHQLIFLRLVRTGAPSRDPQALTLRNSRVARYVWSGTGIVAVLSTSFLRSTPILIILAIAFCGAYIWLYIRMVRLRTPKWLITTLTIPSSRKSS